MTPQFGDAAPSAPVRWAAPLPSTKMNPKVQLRTTMTESQAEILLQRLSLLPLNIGYRKEQYGVLVVVVIDCTAGERKIARDILHEFAARRDRRFDMQQWFKVGQRVFIRRDDPSPFAGLPALIEDVQPNDRGVDVLDRYVVVFSWGEKHTFYEPQLQFMEDES